MNIHASFLHSSSIISVTDHAPVWRPFVIIKISLKMFNSNFAKHFDKIRHIFVLIYKYHVSLFWS